MKLLYYLPAIGNPNIEIKQKILLHNLLYIYRQINQSFDISIAFYDISVNIKMMLNNLPFIDKKYIYEKKGILTELLLTNPNNIYNNNYDYIIFTLDDVKILNMNIRKMIRVKRNYKIKIMSPVVLKSTHWYMRFKPSNMLTIHNQLEVYLLLLRPIDFKIFCSIHTIENKWMWGPDLLFGYYNISAGVLHSCAVEHKLPSYSDGNTASNLSVEYLRKHTKYLNYAQVNKDFSPIKNMIKLKKRQEILISNRNTTTSTTTSTTTNISNDKISTSAEDDLENNTLN
jgi:hypothetical protein